MGVVVVSSGEIGFHGGEVRFELGENGLDGGCEVRGGDGGELGEGGGGQEGIGGGCGCGGHWEGGERTTTRGGGCGEKGTGLVALGKEGGESKGNDFHWKSRCGSFFRGENCERKEGKREEAHLCLPMKVSSYF